MSIEPVQYRTLAGFSFHRVGSDGTVWSCRKRSGLGYGRGAIFLRSEEWRLQKQSTVSGGYLTVVLFSDAGTKTRWRVSHLVLAAFGFARPAGLESLHWNDIKQDNRISNLRWGTAGDNAADRVRNGTSYAGEKNPSAKLTASDVAEIRTLLRNKTTHKSIAARYGVATVTIDKLSEGKTWKQT